MPPPADIPNLEELNQNQTMVPYIAGGFFTNELSEKPGNLYNKDQPNHSHMIFGLNGLTGPLLFFKWISLPVKKSAHIILNAVQLCSACLVSVQS